MSDEIWDEILELFREGEINLNLGCGKFKFKETINCDLYNDTADRKIDAQDLSEFRDGSANAIYASNLLEHFGCEDSLKVLEEWKRVLRMGGYLIIGLPDMEKVIQVIAQWLSTKLDVLPPQRQHYHYMLWISVMKMIYGWQTNEGDFHKWGYSIEYLTQVLEDAGFKINKVYQGYPNRPTPNMMVVAQKNKEEGQ